VKQSQGRARKGPPLVLINNLKKFHMDLEGANFRALFLMIFYDFINFKA